MRAITEDKRLGTMQGRASGQARFMAPGPPGSLLLALIPAYKPAAALPRFVRTLLASGAIQGAVVVDDGSGPGSESVFQELSQIAGVQLLTHQGNLGKGAALKTGMNFISSHYPDCAGVVTADADGQHDPENVVQVARELVEHPGDLVLGVRSFDRSVPLRSRLGNKVTKQVFRAFSRQKVSDTQTGLRGIPVDLIPALTRLAPNGYDFELAALLMCEKLQRPFREVAIRTIYTDGNRSSHFRPLLDSMKIYAVFVRFAAVSLLSAILDNAVFLLAFATTGNIFASQLTGRISSLTFNYCSNRSAVFHSRARMATTIPGYLCLAAALMLGSYGLIRLAVSVWGWNVMAAKVAAETLLFSLSFIIQRCFIFAPGRTEGLSLRGQSTIKSWLASSSRVLPGEKAN